MRGRFDCLVSRPKVVETVVYTRPRKKEMVVYNLGDELKDDEFQVKFTNGAHGVSAS